MVEFKSLEIYRQFQREQSNPPPPTLHPPSTSSLASSQTGSDSEAGRRIPGIGREESERDGNWFAIESVNGSLERVWT